MNEWSNLSGSHCVFDEVMNINIRPMKKLHILMAHKDKHWKMSRENNVA